MSTPTQTRFRPDYTQTPGEYLREIFEHRGIKIVDFATRCGRPAKTISEILAGETAITPETALQFERVLGVPARLWLSLEAQHQLVLATQRRADTIDADIEWMELFPIREMQDKGFVPKSNDRAQCAEELLSFFGVSTPQAWYQYWDQKVSNARFKQTASLKIDTYAISAWLKKGDVEASLIDCEPYSESAFRLALTAARQLSQKRWPTFREALVSRFASAGVALVFVRDLSKTGLRGAAYWAAKEKAVVIVSDRLKSERAFWFALFHEAVHVLLHSKKALFIDYDNDKGADGNQEEREADDTAANMLISPSQIQEFYSKYGRRGGYSEAILREFAKRIEINPSLLLGRLQYERAIPYNHALTKIFNQRMEF